MNPFKYISLEELKSLESPIVYVFTEEEAQQFAEDNYGGQLNEEELSDFVHELNLGDFGNALHEAISTIRPHLRPESLSDMADDA